MVTVHVLSYQIFTYFYYDQGHNDIYSWSYRVHKGHFHFNLSYKVDPKKTEIL